MRPLEKAPDHSKGMAQASKLFLTDKPFTSLINKINNDYLYWDKVKYKKAPQGQDPIVVWAGVKISRMVHSKEISFGKHRFTYNMTDHIQRTLHGLDMNIGGKFGTGSVLPEENREQYLISSVMEEAIASSQIEGAVTTRKHAKEMLRKNLKPKSLSDKMILNNYQTIQHIMKEGTAPMTMERLLKIHAIITNNTLEKKEDEGTLRTNNDIKLIDAADNEVVYTPPKFKEVPALITQLITFCNDLDDDQFIHPIVKGCIIHFMIGFIHPFVDGNGRTARAMFYWYLLKKGYWLTEYLSISRLIMKSKVQYAKAYRYTENDHNDLTYFIHYKMNVMQQAYEELRIYIDKKIKEKKRLIPYQRMQGVNERQAHVLKWLYEEPEMLMTVKELETRFSISNQTGRNDLMGLVELGFLEIIQVDGKTKAFAKVKKFQNMVQEAAGVYG